MPRRTTTPTATLDRVRRILEETCAGDGTGPDLSEAARRKAYRAGINDALAAITNADQATARHADREER